MRDFARTPEPRGSRRKRSKQGGLHYYIQRHHARRLHYDFRLELDGVLKSWAVPKGPTLDPDVRRLAVQTEDHPLEYGEFEGTIPPKQYGAGEVFLWDKGAWIPEDVDPRAALRKGLLHFELRGEKLRGSWVLTRTKGDPRKPSWLLIKRKDTAARHGNGEVVIERPESVKRSRRIPAFVEPQLATLVSEPPASGEWVYEIKYDGYRMLAGLDGKHVRLLTRAGNDWSAKLPHLAAALGKLGLQDTWLDGEIVVPGPHGRSSFQALQNAFEGGADARIVYFVFDAPFLEGRDLRALPLVERKKLLAEALASNEQVRLSEHLEGDAGEVLAKACELGLEGLIGKQAQSPYVSGRSRSWIKLKCRSRQDFVIGGYTPPRGSRRGFGALLVGFHDSDGRLRFAGKVGTGYNDALLKSLSRTFALLRRASPPFADPPREKGVTWLEPKLVAEVAYAEKTREGILRQASFMGLRKDLPANVVHEEKAVSLKNDSVLGVRITHPDREIWPGIAKIELARYYEALGKRLLAHLDGRPLTVVRCPDGAGEKCFYQRHLKGKKAYFSFDSLRQVIEAVQNGAVEFHTWGSRATDPGRPDRITFDLDPGPGVSWADLARAARLTKTTLDGLKLRSFLKTTGGKGLHIVVPLAPASGWKEVKAFSKRVADFLAAAEPALFTANMSKSKRLGKVFVDYLRNSETASAVAAYSARARPGAPVSMPIAWDELGSRDLRGEFTLRSVLGQAGDPWKGYARVKQRLTPEMSAALARRP